MTKFLRIDAYFVPILIVGAIAPLYLGFYA